MRVSVIGPLNIDILVTGELPAESISNIKSLEAEADIEMTVAGSVGYTIQDLSKLGLEVNISTHVAGDSFGKVILDSLQEQGISTDLIRKVPGAVSGIGLYLLLFGSRKRPLFFKLPTHDPWPREHSDYEVERLLNANLLHCGGYLHFNQMYGSLTTLFKEAHSRGLITSMDPQFPLGALDPPWLSVLEENLPYLDLFFCDEHEAVSLTASNDIQTAAEILLNAGVTTVIIKQGEEGSTIYRKGWSYNQTAVKVGKLTDSVGAGDAFDAAFMYCYLKRYSLEDCALFSSVAAGLTITAHGGTNGMPDIEQISEYIH